VQAFTFPSITEALLQNFDRRNVGLRLEPTSTGDTRNNMSAYALLSAIVPFASGVRDPLAAVGLGFPLMWRFLSCQNFSIKRTH
jgi:hypothetical protein